ncbi:MAG: peptidoglycan recognition protein [Actinomycetes bacterium]
MRRALTCIAVLLALPAAARAGGVSMVSRDVPLGTRAAQAVAPVGHFNMLGLHWRGTGSVSFRTRALGGGWQPWQTADTDSAPVAAWHLGNAVWVEGSDGVQYRAVGQVSRLRAYYLWSPPTSGATRRLAISGATAIVTRDQWQADEKIVRAKPKVAPALKLAVVHHTANSNTYTQAQAASIVRGIETYHVQGNGWNDIGYNFLIDRFGTVYEGRGGGIERNVIGAHAEGFNTGTVGIALIGNFMHASPPPAMHAALVRLLSWRLDLAHIDPLSTVSYVSGGNLKFKAGTRVELRAISGHRDSGPSECPGNIAYGLLPSVAREVSTTGLPKLYGPTVTGGIGRDVRFRGLFSGAVPWAVTVRDAAGALVVRHTGRSQGLDWSWNSAAAGAGPFTWTIGAGTDLLPATGRLGRALDAPKPTTGPVGPSVAPPTAALGLLSGMSASPTVLSPAADGSGLITTVGFTLGSPATVTAQVVNVGNPAAAPLKLLSSGVGAGPNTFTWDLSVLADGRYRLDVTATASGGTTATASIDLVVDRSLSGLAVSPSVFSPNSDGIADTAAFTFSLGASVPVQVTIQRAGATVATVYSGQLGPGPQTIGWDGTSAGARLGDGTYTVVVTVTDPFGTISLLQTVVIDTTPPTLTVVDGPGLRFQLSEAATVTAIVNGQPVSVAAPAGSVTVPWTGGPVTSFSAQARDSAGNLGATVSGP